MFEFNVGIGLTKKREESNEHSLYNKSSYAISNMKHYFQPKSFRRCKNFREICD